MSYTIKGKEKSTKKFGFLAQALRGSSFEEAIIWGVGGEPVSIDYKSILVATIYKFFETRKELFQRVQELEAKMQKREADLFQLREEIIALRAAQIY